MDRPTNEQVIKHLKAEVRNSYNFLQNLPDVACNMEIKDYAREEIRIYKAAISIIAGHEDLMSVVRCKDCRKRNNAECRAKHETADMDYCYAGERKEKSDGR